MNMNQEQLGLFLQIIGVGLFTPIIFRWILEFTHSITITISSLLSKMLIKSPVGGPRLADIYLKAVDRLSTGTDWSKTAILLVWSVSTTVLSSISLIGFFAFSIWSIDFFMWVPKWMQIITWILIGLLISDILVASLWDFWLYHTQWGKNITASYSTTSTIDRIGYLLLNNPAKTRPFRKLVANITFFFFYPIGGSILTILHLGVFIGGISKRYKNIGNMAGLVGWATILAGLILQFLV